VRAIRGATCLTADDADEMRDAVGELVSAMLTKNDIDSESVVSVILTATPDLTSTFPAEGARQIGLTDVPLLCAQEMDVRGALQRVVRVMMHVDIDQPRSGIQHVYLRGAEVLRQDLHRG
jgi:chorismate mutase